MTEFRRILSEILFCGIYGILFGFLLIYYKINILILQINPNPIFLSDVAAFEAIIIAFLVPLSIEIVSKVSERYQSDVISRVFDERWENKYLPSFLMLNIFLAIILRFSVQDNINSTTWIIMAWIILFIFLIIGLAILRVIKRIKEFMTNTELIVDELFKDVEKNIE